MKSIVAAGLGALALLWGASAYAKVVTYNATVVLDQSMYQSNGNLIVSLLGEPMDLSPGDELRGTILFGDGQWLYVFNNTGGGAFPGREYVGASFRPDIATTADSTGTFSFLGVSGDYDGSSVLNSLPFSGAVGFSRVTNLTDTFFAFRGVSFDVTYVGNPADLNGGPFPFTNHVTPDVFQVLFTPSRIGAAPVPEPAAWLAMTLGFAAVGVGLRRRKPSHAFL